MIPHNEQKYNSNQTSLQDIGNLPYHTGKSATSYDSINSLTTYNNHYTLLYPDLVQELFNVALHNSNNVKNNALSFGSLGVSNTKYSAFDTSLHPRDILFFLKIVSLYQLELSKGNTSITYPSLKLAKLLGVDASCDTTHLTANNHNSVNSLTDSNMRSSILKMTAKLESIGLLKVFRRKRKNGMDMANKLVPVLPDRLHTRLKDLPANLKVSDSSKLNHESNLEHILRTKLFVPIELDFMKSLFKNDLPSKYKLFFLNCIMSTYRNFRQNSSNVAEENTIDVPNIFSFSATSSELMKKNNISRSTLDRIFRYIKQQGDSFFLQVEHKYTKSDDIDCNRYDKSIFIISINPLVFPISHISEKNQSQTERITNFDCVQLQDDVLPIFPDTYRGFKTAWSKKQPSIVKKTAHNNKDIILKNKYIDVNYENLENSSIPCSSSTSTSIPITKNTVVNHQEEFLEEELCSSSSKSYNNSSFLDVSSSRNISEQKKEWRELRQFYPLFEKDVDMLNSRANREFSNNFVNQLLLKLYIKYPEKRFKNRFTFLSYMTQILSNEKHQGPLVNHPSFRFNCNINTAEKNLLEQEKYLNQIEDSLDTSKEMQFKKKIAGRFSSEVAYKILTKVEFKKNHDDSFITVIIPSRLELGGVRTEGLGNRQANNLSKSQITYLSEQLEAVYGINRYYVQEVEEAERIEDVKPEIVGGAKGSEDIGILGNSHESDTTSGNTAWHQIRKTLREELGDHIDQAWFAKAVATESEETKTLTLTMPTRFMSDWVKNNYSHAIRRFAIGVGIKMVEYSYD